MALPDLGPYRMLERLGGGSYGDVVLAEDTRLRRHVAIKSLIGALTADKTETRRRLLREARAAARLNHPHIATVYDVIESPGDVHIVMEYVPGSTLAARLRSGPLPPMEVVELGVQLSSALAHAHSLGVIHRDLKPGNIMITPQRQAKILDFGLALLRESDLGSSDGTAERHRIVGTAPYIPPEHLRGAPVDVQGDVYSLGVTLFELLTGRRPFAPDEEISLETAILTRPTPSARAAIPDVPPKLDEVVQRAMARARDERFNGAAALESALRALADRVSDAPTQSWERPAPPSRSVGKPRLAWAIAAALAVGAGLLVATGLVPRGRPSAAGDPAASRVVVAVLPLTGASADAQSESLAAGVADALITSLARVPDLTVVSRSATLKYREGARDVDAIARELGANLVVDGALQRSGDNLQVTMTVLQPGSNLIRWRGAYGGTFAQVFRLQEEVAGAVATAVSVNSVPKADGATPPTQDVEAFAEYAQARSFLERPDVKDNLDRSITLFQGALQKDPGFARAYAGLGEAFWRKFEATRQQDWATQARDAITEALRLDPTDTSVRQSLAVLYRGLGRFDQAIDELRRITVSQPASDEAHRLLGQILIQRGRHDEGVAEIREAIRLRPQYWAHHATLGQAYYQARRWPEALPAFRRVTQLQPDSAWGYQMLGATFQSMGDNPSAIGAYQRAIKLGNAKAHANLGIIYFDEGRRLEALPHFREAARLEPAVAMHHHSIGVVLESLGRESESRAAYERSAELCRLDLAVRPDNAPTLALLAITEAVLGRAAEAERHIARAVALAADDADVRYSESVVRARAGQREQAIEALRAAISAGYPPERARRDPHLASLKSHPAYAAALTPPKSHGGKT